MWNLLCTPIRKLTQTSVLHNRQYSQLLPISAAAITNNDSTSYRLFNYLIDIWDGLLLAAPKKRRSIAKRRHLRKFKALKPRNDIEDCVMCGSKKLQGKLCQNCFQWTMSLTEKVWQKQKDEGGCRTDRFVK